MCDTMVALGNATKSGKVIFAKNSDREPDEPAEILHVPRINHDKGAEVQTTYITIPQARETAEILLCKPIWIWGAEMGTNEYGVTIGNEAVYTKEKYQKQGGLLGMDLLRLGLERSKSAAEALEVIIDLLELYGQGGNCGYRSKLYYHNSFIIADKSEAWVLETADKYWIAEKVTDIRTISNTITIQGKGDIRHPKLIEHAIEKGWCKDSEDFSFSKHYLDKFKLEQIFAYGKNRHKCSTNLLRKDIDEITVETMMNVLRYHYPTDKKNWRPDRDASFKSICVHAKNLLNPSQSTISMISELNDNIQTHWITGTSAPCTSLFKPFFMPKCVPQLTSNTSELFNENSLWWLHEKLHREVLKEYPRRLNSYKDERNSIEEKMIKEVKNLLQSKASCSDLKKYTEEMLLTSEEQTKEWIDLVTSLPIKKKNRLLYRKYWSKRSKKNKL